MAQSLNHCMPSLLRLLSPHGRPLFLMPVLSGLAAVALLVSLFVTAEFLDTSDAAGRGLLLALLVVLMFSLIVVLWLWRRLRASEASLARAEAEWVQALDFAEDAMYLVDLDERVVRGNRAFYRFLGRKPEEIIGQNIMHLMHGAQEKVPCPVCRARLDRRDAVFVKEANDPMNRWQRPIEIIVKIIRDSANEPMGVLMVFRDLSRQREIEHTIRESEERYRVLSQAAFDGIAIHDAGVVVAFNPTLAAMLGYNETEVVGTNLLSYVAEPSLAIVKEQLCTAATEPRDVLLKRKDGSYFAAEARARDFPFHGRMQRVVAVRDLRELEKAQQALFAEKERLMVTLQSIGEGVIVTDIEGRVQYLNPVAEKLLGVVEAQARAARLLDLCRIVDERRMNEPLDLVQSCLAQDTVVTSINSCLLRRPDGSEFGIEHSAGPIRDRDGRLIGVVLALRDVTEMRQLAHQLSYQASHDALTGLINRHEFEQRLEAALRSAREHGKQHVLCYLDLDQFKVVNDTCGHVAGDQLLKQIAALITPRVRDNDTVARLGGDEFGVLLEGCSLPKALEIAGVLHRVVAEFRFVWRDRAFDVGVSIGIATLTADNAGVTEVLSAADAACYVAKDLGRNRIHVYQPDDAALARHHGDMEWAQQLSGAIKEGRLRLYSQPVIALQAANRPAWHEILVRLVDDHGQVVPPMAFIPAAERYNLMPAVDRWVVSSTLAWLRQARQSGIAQMCSINLSGRSLGDNRFLDFVLAEVGNAGVDPGLLTFEITETAAVANFAQAQQFIVALRNVGCRFALDDFGSGLSSFAYLKHLPVDYLKIDGHFVRDLGEDPVSLAMVEAINHLGHVMGIQTIAEYVESPEVLEKLRALGVDYAQGFAIQQPAPIGTANGAAGIKAAQPGG